MPTKTTGDLLASLPRAPMYDTPLYDSLAQERDFAPGAITDTRGDDCAYARANLGHGCGGVGHYYEDDHYGFTCAW